MSEPSTEPACKHCRKHKPRTDEFYQRNRSGELRDGCRVCHGQRIASAMAVRRTVGRRRPDANLPPFFDPMTVAELESRTWQWGLHNEGEVR